jgi:5-methylcytosine-specific restriction protein B
MNTADRSVEALDTALRRRFSFEFMPPRLETLKDDSGEKVINGISLFQLLDTINKRLTYLLDEDHQIGHSYFIDIMTEDQLKRVFKNNILPLLSEFFYNDFGKIRLILGDGFVAKRIDVPTFASIDDEDVISEKSVYAIHTIDENFDIIAALQKTLV